MSESSIQIGENAFEEKPMFASRGVGIRVCAEIWLNERGKIEYTIPSVIATTKVSRA